MEGHAVKKIIDEGAFRAVVDASDLNDVKIAITMNIPLHVSDYKPNDEPWNWEKDIAKEASYLRMEVDSYLRSVWQAQKGMRQYVV